jgi:YfiR/HmsC-like
MLSANSSPALRCGLRAKAGAVVCLAMAGLFVLAALGQATQSDYDVKAGYLFNFGKFLRISGDATPPRHSTFDICVLGHDYMGHVLDDLAANQSIDGRPVRILRVSDAYAARECDIVFISADEGDGIPLDLDAIGRADVLTVSDSPDFLKYGGMIQFVMEDNHVRFAVNLEEVNHTHILLSSELLRVASSVRGRPAGEALR